MCLIELAEPCKQDELAKLPDVFPCWKVIQRSGHCYYDRRRTQPKLTRRTHIAQDFPGHRMRLRYPSSFHAYLKMPILTTPYDRANNNKVVKCWARKEDINCIGHTRSGHTGILAVAVSKITRK